MDIEAKYDKFTPAIACFYDFFINDEQIYADGFKIIADEKRMTLELPVGKEKYKKAKGCDYVVSLLGKPMKFKGQLYDELRKEVVKKFEGTGTFKSFTFEAKCDDENHAVMNFKADVELLSIE